MKKNMFLFKNYIFYFVFRFVIAKIFILLIGTLDFDDLMVFLSSHCQVTKLHFSRLYIFLVLIAK